MAGITKQALNAIRATEFLLEEIEEQAINEVVRSAFDNQITEFTSDMKLLVDDVKTKIDDHLKSALKEVSQATTGMPPQAGGNIRANSQVTQTYASALFNPPLHVNPKLAAKEGIRARQFVLMGLKVSTFVQYGTQNLKEELNKAAHSLGLKERKIRLLLPQKDGNHLIEVNSDASAKWFSNSLNSVEFCSILGEDISFKTRVFNVLAFNVLLTVDPSDDKHREEINEVNDLERTQSKQSIGRNL
jgi:hypothetical protein